jgi:NADP-dependent 3-hydroxy acid dehydrogenase YdfG
MYMYVVFSACAEVFFKHGCKVILAGRNVQQLQEVKSSLADQLPKVILKCRYLINKHVHVYLSYNS